MRTSHRSCLTSDLPCLTDTCPQKFLALIFFLLLKLYYFTKANFQSVAPACIMCINPTNRMRGQPDTTKQDAVRRRFKDLNRKSDGWSIYLYIYHDSGDVDLLTEASLRLGPITTRTRICKAKWAEPFKPPPPPPLSLSLTLHKLEIKLARSWSAGERCTFSEKRVHIG